MELRKELRIARYFRLMDISFSLSKKSGKKPLILNECSQKF